MLLPLVLAGAALVALSKKKGGFKIGAQSSGGFRPLPNRPRGTIPQRLPQKMPPRFRNEAELLGWAREEIMDAGLLVPGPFKTARMASESVRTLMLELRRHPPYEALGAIYETLYRWQEEPNRPPTGYGIAVS